jgi:hypothetical protein
MEQSTTAQRRLVKSPPELWAEISSAENLGRHLSEFGEIRITRVDPETTVAWEGDRASGTVELAPAGWGTKVVLTATPVAAQAAAPAAVVEPEPQPQPQPAPVVVAPPPPAAPRRRRGFFAWLFRRIAPAAEIPAPGPPVHDPSPPTPAPDPTPPDPGPAPPTPAPDPAPPDPGPVPAPDPAPPIDPVPPAPDPTPPPSIELDPERTAAILTGMLDELGAAHRRFALIRD